MPAFGIIPHQNPQRRRTMRRTLTNRVQDWTRVYAQISIVMDGHVEFVYHKSVRIESATFEQARFVDE